MVVFVVILVIQPFGFYTCLVEMRKSRHYIYTPRCKMKDSIRSGVTARGKDGIAGEGRLTRLSFTGLMYHDTNKRALKLMSITSSGLAVSFVMGLII